MRPHGRRGSRSPSRSCWRHGAASMSAMASASRIITGNCSVPVRTTRGPSASNVASARSKRVERQFLGAGRAAVASQRRLAGDERGASRRRGACALARPRPGAELGGAHQGSSPRRPCCRAAPRGRRRPRAALRRPRPVRWRPSARCHARSSVSAAALRGQLRMGRAALGRASPPGTPPRAPAGDGSAGRHAVEAHETHAASASAKPLASAPAPADSLVSSPPPAASARRPSSRERRGRGRGTRVWSDAGSVTDSSSGTMPERAGRS